MFIVFNCTIYIVFIHCNNLHCILHIVYIILCYTIYFYIANIVFIIYNFLFIFTVLFLLYKYSTCPKFPERGII